MNPRFKFETPVHGWMTISVSIDEREWSFEVSDAVVDSLDLLSKALLRLHAGSRREEVEWFLEPEWLSWCFAVEGEEVTMECSLENDSEAVFSIQLQRADLLQRMTSALKTLQERTGRTEAGASEKTWSWEFPTKALEDLWLGLQRESG